MAFLRAQGNRILVLHSRRDGKRVSQERLHAFRDVHDAARVLRSDTEWRLLVDSLELATGTGTIDREGLRENLRSIVAARLPAKEEDDPLDQACASLAYALSMLKPPLTPPQLLSLQAAQESMVNLQQEIGNALLLLERATSPKEDSPMTTAAARTSAEDMLDHGLTHFEHGEWDLARECFQTGLMVDPEHVDLLVHAGLVEHVLGNEDLALSRYERAAEIGKADIDAAIAASPEEYVKLESLDQWADGKRCHDAEECPDWSTERCLSCEHSPRNSFTRLYRHTEFRPFFRALTNKASTLMRLRRYDPAIEALMLSRAYDELWGVRNMIGECYLCSGDVAQAAEWYHDLLWPHTFYVRGLILSLLGQRAQALRHLLTGITQNPHIARILVGAARPEPIRYIGEALPNALAASEFVHEHGHLFAKRPEFGAMLRCAIDDPALGLLMRELIDADRRHREIPSYRVPQELFRLMSGAMDEEFLSLHVPRLMQSMSDPTSDHWIPTDDAVLRVEIVEKKRLNWLVSLPQHHGRRLYVRPGASCPDAREGDTVELRVAKWWHYRRRLFIAAEAPCLVS